MRGLLKLLALHSKVLRAHSLLPALAGSDRALPPAIVQLELTHRCNLNCPMCYQSRPGGAAGELSAAEWKALIDALPRWALLTLTGGDPFMRADFAEIFAYASERNRCNILTNGELLDRHIQALAGRLPLIGISVDGLAATHDAARRKPGLFAAIERNVRLLQEEKKRLGTSWPLVDIKTVILPENLGELPEVFRFAASLGADYWSLSLPKISEFQFANRYTPDLGAVLGSRPVKTFLPGEGAARERLLSAVREIAGLEDGPVVRFYPYNMLSEKAVAAHLDNALRPEEFEPCRVPWSFACVSPNGDVFPCLCYRAGNVRETPFREIWNGPGYRKFRAGLSKRALNNCCLGCCYSVYKK